ncbi:MAG: chemotaxis protein [Aliivibrio sp.]|uniref:chemotaxis protein n=1 Tax=Aliivibrio sp. TaxID=1872443 RepID=UPI001A5873AD|nr:chemotaxis protein [Aliivibrio sp.]
MKLEGLILDVTDIQQQTKTNRASGEQTTVGVINMITTVPTSTIQVTIPADMWENGAAAELLKKCVGKRMQYAVEYREFSFANEQGKHVSLSGFHLFELPESKG